MTADERISHLFTYADAVRQLIDGGTIRRGFASRDVHRQLEVGMLVTVVGEDAHQLMRKEGGTTKFGLSTRQMRAVSGARNGFAHQYSGSLWADLEDVVFDVVPDIARDAEAYLRGRGIEPKRLDMAGGGDMPA